MVVPFSAVSVATKKGGTRRVIEPAEDGEVIRPQAQPAERGVEYEMGTDVKLVRAIPLGPEPNEEVFNLGTEVQHEAKRPFGALTNRTLGSTEVARLVSVRANVGCSFTGRTRDHAILELDSCMLAGRHIPTTPLGLQKSNLSTMVIQWTVFVLASA